NRSHKKVPATIENQTMSHGVEQIDVGKNASRSVGSKSVNAAGAIVRRKQIAVRAKGQPPKIAHSGGKRAPGSVRSKLINVAAARFSHEEVPWGDGGNGRYR